MKVEELYKITKSIMFEKATSKDYDNYYIDNINIVLSECFDVNNNLRLQKGLDELLVIPKVTKKDDTIPYEDVVCREVLPKGLASKFFIDDDLAKFNIFNTDYLNAQSTYTRLIYTPIKDVYA